MSFVKVCMAAGKIRTANPLRVAFVFMFKQIPNMDTVLLFILPINTVELGSRVVEGTE
jgi:hypothetical protein